eukprot:g1801.t1
MAKFIIGGKEQEEEWKTRTRWCRIAQDLFMVQIPTYIDGVSLETRGDLASSAVNLDDIVKNVVTHDSELEWPYLELPVVSSDGNWTQVDGSRLPRPEPDGLCILRSLVKDNLQLKAQALKSREFSWRIAVMEEEARQLQVIISNEPIISKVSEGDAVTVAMGLRDVNHEMKRSFDKYTVLLEKMIPLDRNCYEDGEEGDIEFAEYLNRMNLTKEQAKSELQDLAVSMSNVIDRYMELFNDPVYVTWKRYWASLKLSSSIRGCVIRKNMVQKKKLLRNLKKIRNRLSKAKEQALKEGYYTLKTKDDNTDRKKFTFDPQYFLNCKSLTKNQLKYLNCQVQILNIVICELLELKKKARDLEKEIACHDSPISPALAIGNLQRVLTDMKIHAQACRNTLLLVLGTHGEKHPFNTKFMNHILPSDIQMSKAMSRLVEIAGKMSDPTILKNDTLNLLQETFDIGEIHCPVICEAKDFLRIHSLLCEKDEHILQNGLAVAGIEVRQHLLNRILHISDLIRKHRSLGDARTALHNLIEEFGPLPKDAKRCTFHLGSFFAEEDSSLIHDTVNLIVAFAKASLHPAVWDVICIATDYTEWDGIQSSHGKHGVRYRFFEETDGVSVEDGVFHSVYDRRYLEVGRRLISSYVLLGDEENMEDEVSGKYDSTGHPLCCYIGCKNRKLIRNAQHPDFRMHQDLFKYCGVHSHLQSRKQFRKNEIQKKTVRQALRRYSRKFEALCNPGFSLLWQEPEQRCENRRNGLDLNSVET